MGGRSEKQQDSYARAHQSRSFTIQSSANCWRRGSRLVCLTVSLANPFDGSPRRPSDSSSKSPYRVAPLIENIRIADEWSRAIFGIFCLVKRSTRPARCVVGAYRWAYL